MAAAELRSGRNPDIKNHAAYPQSGLLLQKTESLTLAQFFADLLDSTQLSRSFCQLSQCT